MFQPPYTLDDEASVEAMRSIEANFIGKSVQITVTDNRIFEGRFVCVDNKVNVILQGAYQYNPQMNKEGSKQWAGMVMLPGKHIVSAAVLQDDHIPHYQFPQDQNLYI